jgi:Cu-Zn family superoxide dismutase
MKKVFCRAALAAALVKLVPGAAWAATAALKSPEGADMGTLSLVQTGVGVHITGTVTGLTPGEHGFHIHAVGKCEPDFKAAGGHYNPYNTPHGKLGGGPHSGDMDNIVAGADGTAAIDVVNPRVTLSAPARATLFDADGSAVVIHGGADDYQSQPSGAAGPRVACGVVQ